MSSRVSNYPERRTNGTSDNDSNPRPRAAAGAAGASGQSSSRSSQQDQRSTRSPQGSFTNPAHKRTASGNPRPASKNIEERRTERMTITTKEKLMSRTRSAERRSKDAPPPEKWRPKEPPKRRQSETKPKETTKPDAPPGMYMPHFTPTYLPTYLHSSN